MNEEKPSSQSLEPGKQSLTPQEQFLERWSEKDPDSVPTLEIYKDMPLYNPFIVIDRLKDGGRLSEAERARLAKPSGQVKNLFDREMLEDWQREVGDFDRLERGLRVRSVARI